MQVIQLTGMQILPRPALAPGKMAAPGRPGPENFQLCPAPPHPGKRGRCPAPPRPENYPGARIGANVPTSSKVFGSQKLLTSIFSTKGALQRHMTYDNHPSLILPRPTQKKLSPASPRPRAK